MDFALALAAILLTWGVAGAALVGIGLVFRRIFKVYLVSVDDALLSFWMGFGAAILFLQVWHLKFAVSWPATACLGLVGLAGWALHAGSLRDWWTRLKTRRHLALIVALLASALWVANLSMGSGNTSDSGVYHIQAMRWAQAFPIIPGLGNLHGRLAFNSSVPLYEAALAVGPWHDRVEHVANGLLLFVLLAQIVVAARRLRDAGGIPVASAFDLVLLPPVVAMCLNYTWVSSLTHDTSATILPIVAASVLFRMLATRLPSPGERGHQFVVAATLVTTAMCLKLSAAPFAAVAWGLALWCWRRDTAGDGSRRLALGWAVGLSLALAGVWLARGVLLSGYPAYPSTFGAFPVDWRLPIEQADAERAWTGYSSRWFYNMGLRFPGWAWVPGWIANSVRMSMERGQVVVPSLLFAIALGVSLWKRGSVLLRDRTTLLLAPTVFGIVVWFFTAPDPRFAAAYFWIAAAVAIAPLLARPQPPSARWMAGLAVAAAVTCLACLLGWRGHLPALIVRPGSDHGLHPVIKTALKTVTTESGLTVYAPVRTNLCWDAPLPCTPHPAPNLRTRIPGHMASGFAVDGPWQPVLWPTPLFTDFLGFWRLTLSGRAGAR